MEKENEFTVKAIIRSNPQVIGEYVTFCAEIIENQDAPQFKKTRMFQVKIEDRMIVCLSDAAKAAASMPGEKVVFTAQKNFDSCYKSTVYYFKNITKNI